MPANSPPPKPAGSEFDPQGVGAAGDAVAHDIAGLGTPADVERDRRRIAELTVR